MVLRNRRWPLIVLAAACFAAAGPIDTAAANPLEPMDGHMPGLKPAGPPPGGAAMPRGRLVWDGPVPPMPRAGAATVYVPSTGTGNLAVMPPPAETVTPAYPVEAAPLPPIQRARAEPSYAALEDDPIELPPPLPPGRGVQPDGAPSGYRVLPKGEAMCRRALAEMGAEFSEAGSVRSAGACGIPHALKVRVAVRGIAMQPAATLNCGTALAVARWLDQDVRSAARWRLWKNPTAVINASSYRCSRIAGSRTVSEHASGNALDVGGFRFSDGSTVRVEPKGLFSFRERGFQNSVRRASCRHFGTVLGPGYNRAHDDHFHLDSKSRRRAVCK